MANHTTGAQRHNNRMNKIFENYKRNLKDPNIKSFKRHQRKLGIAVKDRGVDYPGPKSSTIKKVLDKHKK